MADQNQLINQISGLDFDEIKDNLKVYLQNQDRFLDYDFDGSNLSALLNVMAYDTFYKGFYMNMLATEMNLSTAIKRKNVVNNAKDLGYVPRSVTAAHAIVDLELTLDEDVVTPPAFISVPLGTKFTAEIEGTRYTFQTLEEYLATDSDADEIYTIEDVELVEGRRLTHKFIIPSDDTTGVVLPNTGVDTSRLTVTVKTTASSTDEVIYNPPTDYMTLDGSSLVYFVQEQPGEKHKIVFGDGVLGRALVPGNVVTVTYLVSAGADANNAANFELSDEITSITQATVTSTASASGGSDLESIQQVKFNAPLVRQTQNRAVTATDFAALVKSNFPQYRSAIAWGGEDNDPIALGYVFISIKPDDRLYLVEAEKYEIENLFKTIYNVLTVEAVVVDPEYLFVKPTVSAKYIESGVAGGADSLRATIIQAIRDFSDDSLEAFNNYFRYSKFVATVDAADIAITNSLADIRIEKRISANTQDAQAFTIRLHNAIDENTVRSNLFSITVSATPYTTAFFKDDGSGNIDLYYINGSSVETLLDADVGTVDYEEGIIELDAFEADSADVRLSAVPASYDVLISRNVILEIDDADISVTVSEDV